MVSNTTIIITPTQSICVFEYLCDIIIDAAAGTPLRQSLEHEGCMDLIALLSINANDIDAFNLNRGNKTRLKQFLLWYQYLVMNNSGVPLDTTMWMNVSHDDFVYFRMSNITVPTNHSIIVPTLATGTTNYGITSGTTSTTVYDFTKRIESESSQYAEKVVAHTYDVESVPVLQPKEYYTYTNQKKYLQLDYDSELVWKHGHNSNVTKDASLMKYHTDVPYNPNKWKGRTIQLYLNPSEHKCILYPVIGKEGEHEMVVHKVLGECCAY